ncbi:DUF397 domain-containing protein [Yinghuangia soli]|uniref:DUF397 domain-containing protein n=1 Tax=Yinghuangia soli TaxID=2908204 RepID=A0AA41PW77_9ACTN|nr:DUF397 domain-containing protein [Yinghuangia soli]MCF2526326.1 DUF397 domain-containing protein [Yinghuangia soli]
MTMGNATGGLWHRSSHSGLNNNCVEVAAVRGDPAVRDSKSAALPAAFFPPRAWRAFLGAVRTGTPA